MNKVIFSSLIFGALFLMFSCNKEDDTPAPDPEPEPIEYEYHAHVHSPSTDDKNVGDNMHLHVEFESHAGETVHHVNVRIYNKADNTEIYNKPDVAHIETTESVFEWHDDFVLSNDNGVNAHTDWILEAKVWGEADGEGEVIETVEFHVHPE